ncbi:MAG TPA: hypothetical protein VFO91_07820, partial [Anaerolineales bacterium]|nr:hypothetical protein [Anaerolineales bacterium]
YYVGAKLILDGQPLEKAGQATERPLFPGFLSSMLMLTGQNLKITLAIIVQLAGISLYLSGREVSRFIGVFPASLYMTLMYFYIQPLIGYTLSEMLGFMLGCLASALIWRASHNLKWADLTLGLMTLLVAVSARAGAFLIFPALALWIGWIFRGERRFSLKMASGSLIVILIGFYLINAVYPLLLGVPSGSAFGNFSYALYGQIRGGTGWHSAIEELGTRDPAQVYRAALQFFLQHPISLLIGFAKAYRDFFLLGNRSIFPFGGYSWQNWLNVVLWVGLLLLFTSGLIQSVKNIRSKLSSLLIAGFVGIFLSIPFLPPIDGGSRLYASTIPFFFVIPALGLSQLTKEFEQKFTAKNDFQTATMAPRSISIILLTLTLIAPVVNYALGQKSAYTLPSCPAEQKPFAIEVHQGSYIDLVREGTARCGLVPGVCLGDFVRNNREKTTDDYYQSLLQSMESSNENLQLIPAIDLVGGKFHYFHVSHNSSRGNLSSGLVSGCAVEVLTENQSVYEVSP